MRTVSIKKQNEFINAIEMNVQIESPLPPIIKCVIDLAPKMFWEDKSPISFVRTIGSPWDTGACSDLK